MRSQTRTLLRMVHLAGLAALNQHLATPCTAQELVPPPRFADCRFAGYRVNADVPGQAMAVQAVQRFAVQRGGRWLRRLRGGQPGLYLDGDFGVGKTHLLASSFAAAHGKRRYLAFSEAISLMIQRGPAHTLDLLAAELVCIDEFELDDPSNTRLIDLLIDGLVQRGCRIMVTSNSIPGELGAGRFPVEDFRRQLVRISSVFQDVHVPGRDYRLRQRAAPDSNPPWWGPEVLFPAEDGLGLSLSADALDRLLQDTPVINLRRLARSLRWLAIDGLESCPDQFAALRLVHLIDRLYDYKVAVYVRSSIAVQDVFRAEYRDWAFAKKYRRCVSRLHECCAPEVGAA